MGEEYLRVCASARASRVGVCGCSGVHVKESMSMYRYERKRWGGGAGG